MQSLDFRLGGRLCFTICQVEEAHIAKGIFNAAGTTNGDLELCIGCERVATTSFIDLFLQDADVIHGPYCYRIDGATQLPSFP